MDNSIITNLQGLIERVQESLNQVLQLRGKSQEV